MGSARAIVVAGLLLAAVPARAERVTLRVGTQAIDGSRYMADILALGKKIEERTRGGVHLEWVSNGQLGDEPAMADQIARGTLDGGGFSETGLAAIVPEMAVWQLPGLFQSYAEVDRATSALDATVRDRFSQRDMVFVMWADLGFSYVFATEPIASLRDVLVKGTPWIPMALDRKLTEAILHGGARAWAMPPLFMLAIGGDKARARSSLRYRYVVGGLVVSRQAWARLGPELQQTVLDVCREQQLPLRERWRRETDKALAVLDRSGVSLRPAGEAELAAFLGVAEKARATRASQPRYVDLPAIDAAKRR
jgi:TRAP-type transport system periplasmic protein